MMADVAIQEGVAKEDIIIENQSNTTRENVINTGKILEKLNLKPGTNIILISSQCHIKRCKYLMKNFFRKDLNYILCYCKDNETDEDCWQNNEKGRYLVRKEIKETYVKVLSGNLEDYEV